VDVSSGEGSVKVDQVALPSYPHILKRKAWITVSIEAVPASGYTFNGWSGDLSGNNNPTILLISCNKNISASFSREQNLAGLIISSSVILVALATAIIVRRKAG